MYVSQTSNDLTTFAIVSLSSDYVSCVNVRTTAEQKCRPFVNESNLLEKNILVTKTLIQLKHHSSEASAFLSQIRLTSPSQIQSSLTARSTPPLQFHSKTSLEVRLCQQIVRGDVQEGRYCRLWLAAPT